MGQIVPMGKSGFVFAVVWHCKPERDIMKSTSRIALATAGLLFGLSIAPANAAGLPSKDSCCADLEERVAELEATTARKGNRVVSLQIYGQVNKALLLWDDGIDSDAYIVDNTNASSRLGIIGKAQIKPGFIAGYNIEMEILDSRADEVSQLAYNNLTGDFDKAKQGDEGSDGLRLRQNYWYLESDKFGRISIGQQNTASSGTSEVVLGNSLSSADPNIGANFCVRTQANPRACNGGINQTTIKRVAPVVGVMQWGEDFTADRINDVIRYDSPTLYGFVLSASWGDNDYADVALRFKKEFGDFRAAAAISYQWDSEQSNVEIQYFDQAGNVQTGALNLENEVLAGSVSLMHMPTGLYAAFAAGNREYTEEELSDQSFWYIQAGIERKFLSYGTTTLYGEYGEYDSFYLSSDENNNDSNATRFGFGINQKIDAAAMDVYANATFWSFDDNSGNNYEDLTTVLLGTRIRF
jgi:predicted porin